MLACGRVTGPQPLNIDLVVHGIGSKKAHGFSYKWVKSEQCRTSTSYMYVVPPYVSSLLAMFSSTKVPMSRLPHARQVNTAHGSRSMPNSSQGSHAVMERASVTLTSQRDIRLFMSHRTRGASLSDDFASTVARPISCSIYIGFSSVLTRVLREQCCILGPPDGLVYSICLGFT